MDAPGELRRFFEAVNERRWSGIGSDLAVPDARVHLPGIGVEAASWEEAIAATRAFVESTDARYEVDDVVEHGPFVVAFVTVTGTIDGRRSTWSACNVQRMGDDKVVETWMLRGSDPAPVGAG